MNKNRFFALFFAILFLVTSSSLAIAFIVANVESKNNSGSSTSSQDAAGTKLSGFTPVSTVTALKTTDIKVGTGPAVTDKDTVTINYTGALASTGIIFQSTAGSQPITQAVNGFIPGFQEGIIGMKAGGERQVLIPASLAYGSQSSNGIPANSALVFDISLVSISK